MAAAAVYQPSVYDSLPSLVVAATSLKERNPESLLKNQIADLFLKHQVYQELAICLIHRHFDLSPSEKLVENGAVSCPWQYSQQDSDVVGGAVVPRSWTFRNGQLFPFEFGFNENLQDAVYKQLPDKPQFYVELNALLDEHGMTDLLGLTLTTGDNPPGTVKFEKSFDRANVIFTINDGGVMDAKDAVTAQWACTSAGDFTVPVKKLECRWVCVCTVNVR
ncbi:hypothetical protein ACQRIT_002735 [Beauveria bassiana]